MRKYVDCRDYPSENNCSLRISGTEQEVLDAAYDHAIKVHGHLAGHELRDGIRNSMKDEEEAGLGEGRRFTGAAGTIDQPGI